MSARNMSGPGYVSEESVGPAVLCQQGIRRGQMASENGRAAGRQCALGRWRGARELARAWWWPRELSYVCVRVCARASATHPWGHFLGSGAAGIDGVAWGSRTGRGSSIFEIQRLRVYAMSADRVFWNRSTSGRGAGRQRHPHFSTDLFCFIEPRSSIEYRPLISKISIPAVLESLQWVSL